MQGGLSGASAALTQNTDGTATLTITPESGKTFATAPTVTANGATVSGPVKQNDGSYVYTLSNVKANAAITVSGKAVANASTATVTQTGLSGASAALTQNTDGTATLTVKPENGKTFATAPTVTANGATVSGPVKQSDGSYVYTLSGFKADAKITVSGKATTPAKPIQTSTPAATATPAPTTIPVDDSGVAVAAIVGGVAVTAVVGGTVYYYYGPMTRIELAAALYKLDGNPAVTTQTTFSDVAGNPLLLLQQNAVAWAEQSGIVSAYEDGSFKPLGSLTRENFAVIVYNYAKAKGYNTAASADLSAYTDAADITPEALPAMRWAVASGLLPETKDGTLSPQSKLTRPQVKKALEKLEAMR